MREHAAVGTAVDWNGTHYEVLITPRETSNKMGMFGASGEPGDGPPRHLHHAADELFIVFSGRLRFWRAGEIFECGSGEVFHIPAGTEHTFIVLAPVPARWFAILCPGGLESFFPDAVARGLQIPRDMAAVKALAAEYDMAITGPPLTL